MTLKRNILIFHQAALGDFIMTWPLALGLGRVLAQSRLFYITGAQKGALAERALRVESVDVESGWHQLYSSDPKLPEPASRLLRGALWIINFVAGDNELWMRNVRQVAPEARIVSLELKPPEDSRLHVSDFLLRQLSSEPVAKAALEQMLKSVATRGLGMGGVKNGPILIHPGAGSDAKCWPVDRFIDLASELKANGRRIRFVIGEVELEKWAAAQVEKLKATADVVTPASLVALLEVIGKSGCLVGNDSGPGHLAGMMGVPTVSIFGPRDPHAWRPLGPNVQIVSGEWDTITTEAVTKLIG